MNEEEGGPKTSTERNKIEIKKSEILTKQLTSKTSSVIKLQLSSFFGIIMHIILTSIAFSVYCQFLSKSDIYSNGLYSISRLLNYTITSSD
jgi:hypothetical protein